MKLQIAFFVVSFLKQNVGSDTGFFEQAVIIYGRCGNIDVNAADRAVFMLDAVNGVDRIQIIIHRIVNRIFSGFQRQTLVSHILQGNDFLADFLLCQFFSGDMFIFQVVRTVGAAVDAVVGQIKRREHHNPVSIEIFFDLFRKFEDFLILFLVGTGEENGSFTVGQPFPFFCFFDQRIDQCKIVFVFIGVGECFQNFLMVDKIIGTF